VAIPDGGGRDATAFERVYHDNEAMLFDYLARRLGPRRAEMAVAETLAVAWKQFPELAPNACLRAWLLGLALDQVDELRREEVEYLHQAVHERDDESDVRTDPTLCEAHLSSRVARALTDLSPFDRDLLTLHLWTDLGPASLAELTGMRVALLTQRLRMARRFVRERLRP
jgi:DNA-directed RNA polymerase specialized sigma24 family protein